jgi:hypothetical protein
MRIDVDITIKKPDCYGNELRFLFQETVPNGINPIDYLRSRINGEIDRVKTQTYLGQSLMAIEDKTQEVNDVAF